MTLSSRNIKLTVAGLTLLALAALLLGLHAGSATAGSAATAEASFGVLAKAPTAADKDDAEVIDIAGKATDVGIDPSRARTLGTVRGSRIWLMPAKDQLCIGAEPLDKSHVRFAYACNVTSEAAVNGVGVQLGDTIYGAVPDGATELTVTATDGASSSTPVTRNTYSLNAGQYIATFRTAEGTRTFGINK